jgi:hypothetical protein
MLQRRLLEEEAMLVPVGDERVLHQYFFNRGLGFPLHNFICGS